MGKIKNALAKADVTLYNAAYNAKAGMADIMTRKLNGDSQLVVALVLIAVAVGLCVIFQSSLKGILTEGMGKTTKAVSDMFAGSVTPPKP
ncbi:MAG: hypothetical protein RR415_06570 [Ruthenibacterium sp.]